MRERGYSPDSAAVELLLRGSLDEKVGNFGIDKESDFVVLRWSATDLQKLRTSRSRTLEEKLFAVMILGDDRNIEATYVAGKRVYLNSR